MKVIVERKNDTKTGLILIAASMLKGTGILFKMLLTDVLLQKNNADNGLLS